MYMITERCTFFVTAGVSALGDLEKASLMALRTRSKMKLLLHNSVLFLFSLYSVAGLYVPPQKQGFLKLLYLHSPTKSKGEQRTKLSPPKVISYQYLRESETRFSLDSHLTVLQNQLSLATCLSVCSRPVKSQKLHKPSPRMQTQFKLYICL